MKNGNYFAEYEKVGYDLFEKFKQQYLQHMDKARDWKIAHDMFYNNIMPPYYKDNAAKLTALGPGVTNDFRMQWENRYQLNKSKDRPEIFNELVVELIKPDKRTETVKLLGEAQGLATMSGYLTKQEVSWMDSQTKKQPSEINKVYQSPINWKGTNETEFIQLIYALHKAGYLDNEEKQITSLVWQMATAFNVRLGRNWQSNFSKSINTRKTGYEPKIFEDLKTHFISYRDKLINKKK